MKNQKEFIVIKAIVKLILYFFSAAFLTAVLSKMGMTQPFDAIAAIFFLTVYYFFSKKQNAKNRAKVEAAAQVERSSNGVEYFLEGPQDLLEVYPSKIILTPKKHLSAIINKGVVGSKTIPFSSITAIQLKLGDTVNGYIQFSLLGGIESRGGIFSAAIDENTCLFYKKDNDLATQIRDYVEVRIGEKRSGAGMSSADSLPNELLKLAQLNAQGILTDEEFANAKSALIGK